jgi:putative transposase
MPRLGRVVLPHDPDHIVQRGHNKQLVFAEDADYRYYLDMLAPFKALLDIKVHAFCLMSNPVHLIVQPERRSRSSGAHETSGRAPDALRESSGRTQRHAPGRTLHIHSDRDQRRPARLLPRCRAQPGACADDGDAGILSPVALPPARRGGRRVRLLHEDSCCVAAGSTAEARATAYRALVRNAIPQGEWRLIREALQRGQLTGSERLTDQVEAMVRRRIEHRGRGRLRKGRRADAGRK